MPISIRVLFQTRIRFKNYRIYTNITRYKINFTKYLYLTLCWVFLLIFYLLSIICHISNLSIINYIICLSNICQSDLSIIYHFLMVRIWDNTFLINSFTHNSINFMCNIISKKDSDNVEIFEENAMQREWLQHQCWASFE